MVAARQLYAIGVSTSTIRDRVASRRLHPIHRGVYAVGHPSLGNEGKWLAAVLACGDGAVLSHCSAAALWRIQPLPAGSSAWRSAAPIDVTVPGNGGRAKRRGINLRRSRTLQPAECTLRNRIPVTTPARTLDDLRRTLARKEFAAAVREAEFLRLPVAERFEPDRTRTELESKLLLLLRRHRLPKPEVNSRVSGFVVDFLWRAEHLIVEVDGWHSHRSRSAFEDDRDRDAHLKVLGYEVLRFTWRHLDSQPARVARTIRAVLRR